MFDLRYHVASLAAVFLALVIGILVGVGISDRGLVDKAEKSLLQKRVSALQAELAIEAQREAGLTRQQQAAQKFIEDAYPTLMHDRLKGKRIALVFVGSLDGGLRAQIQHALDDAGAASATRVRALKLPIDAKRLNAALDGRPQLARYTGDGRLEALGRALGQELVIGGKTPLWNVLSAQLVEERSGPGRQPVDAVVVVRSVPPQPGDSARFLHGFYSGLSGTDAPAVGVEPSTTAAALSAIAAFQRNGLSSVDDVEMPAGRLALVLLLAGGPPGQYGLRGEDGILPPVPPLPAAPAGG